MIAQATEIVKYVLILEKVRNLFEGVETQSFTRWGSTELNLRADDLKPP